MKKLFALVAALMLALTLAACDGAATDQIVDITLESNIEEAELTQDPEEVTEGMEVTVTASEVDGYTFVQWNSVDGTNIEEVSDDRTYTFTVEGAITLEAMYEESEPDTHNVSLSSEPSDVSLSVSEDGPYETGTEITVEAPELDTYTFQHWLDTDSDTELSTDRAYTFTVDETMNLKAVYEDTLAEDERAAQTVVDAAGEDMGYLDTLMEDYDPEEGMTMTMHMALEEEDPESSGTLLYDMQVELATTMQDGNAISKASFTMDMPDMQDPVVMTMIMEEGADSTTFTMNTEMLLDMIQADEGLDLRTLMDMDSDYVHLTIPHDIEGTDQEALYNQLMDEIYTEMFGEDYTEDDIPDFDQATMDAVMDNLNDMMTFMNFSNLSSYEGVELEMSRDGTMANGTLSVGGAALRAFAEDMFEELYATAELFDENDELPSYTEFTESADYTNVMTLIGSMPDIDINMAYDAEVKSMHIDVAMMTLFNFVTQGSEDLSTIEDITMEMTMEEGATIDEDIANSENLEDLVEEVVKIMTVVNSGSYLGDIQTNTTLTAGTYTLRDLELMGHEIDLPFVDKDLSEVTIDDSGSTPVYSIELYYAESGDAVFDGTSVTLNEIFAVMGDDPTTRQDVLDIIALVDDANFDLYSVFGDILAMSVEQSEQVEASNPIPADDQVTATEPTFYTRYTDSVMFYHQEVNATTDIYGYAVDATADEVHTFYKSYFDAASDWTLSSENADEYGYTLNYTSSDYSIQITILNDSPYDNSVLYSFYVEDLTS